LFPREEQTVPYMGTYGNKYSNKRKECHFSTDYWYEKITGIRSVSHWSRRTARASASQEATPQVSTSIE
jgi:hypothetical protein